MVVELHINDLYRFGSISLYLHAQRPFWYIIRSIIAVPVLEAWPNFIGCLQI